MKISITDLQDIVKLDKRMMRRAAGFVAKCEGVSRDISLVYVDDERIARLNEQFLGHSGPTDVISFNLDDPGDRDGLLGEIVVSAQTARDQARSRHIAVERELLLYTIHGVLHLLGYDDGTPDAARRLRRRQQQLLKAFLEDL